MDVTERKYQFGTEENQAFMKEIREDLLKLRTSVSITRRKLLLPGG